MGCKTCGGPVGKRTKSGECRACANQRMNTDPEVIARRRVGMLRRNRSDPARKEQLRQMMAEARAARKPRSAEHMRRIGELGRAAMTPDVLARRGVSVSNARLAWCPPHLRDEYIFLSVNKRVPAADARQMIEEQNEIEMARWRRSIGVQVDEPEIVTNDLVLILNPVARVLENTARLFGLEVTDITGAARLRKFMVPRYAFALALRRSGVALLRIGEAINRPDHTTARYCVVRGEEWAARGADFAAKVEALQATFAMQPAKLRRAA